MIFKRLQVAVGIDGGNGVWARAWCSCCRLLSPVAYPVGVLYCVGRVLEKGVLPQAIKAAKYTAVCARGAAMPHWSEGRSETQYRVSALFGNSVEEGITVETFRISL